ncbi:MAG: hypothetical protein K0M74_00905 [Sphingopyxis sp.]|nr:hypothetical protein [Sphingopyxis sp.]
MAQDSGSSGPAKIRVDEIVVTAQRCSENLQNVPVTVQAISGEVLEKSRIQYTQDLGLVVPGSVFSQGVGLGSPYLRGIELSRCSRDRKGPCSGETRPGAASSHHEEPPGVMIYATYNRGSKSGLFNTGSLQATPVQPEVLDAFESGIKSELLDRRFLLKRSNRFCTTSVLAQAVGDVCAPTAWARTLAQNGIPESQREIS